MDVDLIKPDFPNHCSYELMERRLAHLVKVTRMFNDVFLEQDHKLDIELKEALEDKSGIGCICRQGFALFSIR